MDVTILTLPNLYKVLVEQIQSNTINQLNQNGGENPVMVGELHILTYKGRTKITQYGTNINHFVHGVPHGGIDWGT